VKFVKNPFRLNLEDLEKQNSALLNVGVILLEKDLKKIVKYAIKNLNLLPQELIKQNIVLINVITNRKKEREPFNTNVFIAIKNFFLIEDLEENIALDLVVINLTKEFLSLNSLLLESKCLKKI
jgi:hypothetical protein